MVRAKVEGAPEKHMSLFTACQLDEGLSMPEGAIELKEGTCVTLIVENSNTEPAQLCKGLKLGEVTPISEVPGEEVSVGTPDAANSEEGSVGSLSHEDELFTERTARLLEQLEMRVDHLTSEQQEQLKNVIVQHADVFALDSSELGTTGVTTHSINTGDHYPIRQPLRRTPFALRSKVDEMVQEMLEQGVVVPSKSPWASPVVLVRKKDGGVRFCVDYRKLNQATKLDEFPQPPFQRLIEVVLAGLAREGCLVYIDDILVIGKTWDEHLANLEKVMDCFRAAGLRLKPKKCKFTLPEVEYLGHVVSADGVRTDPKKTVAVREFSTPVNVKTLHSFLDLASYYRRFVPNFSKVASPSFTLTKKDAQFIWTPQCRLTFNKLKSLLTTAPLLSFPKFDEPFLLETDASGAGLGAVLAQTQEDGAVRPIAYASRSLQPHEKNYSVTELGVVCGL